MSTYVIKPFCFIFVFNLNQFVEICFLSLRYIDSFREELGQHLFYDSSVATVVFLCTSEVLSDLIFLLSYMNLSLLSGVIHTEPAFGAPSSTFMETQLFLYLHCPTKPRSSY